MVKYSDDQLDGIFAALSDRTRRKVLASLEDGSRPVTELASTHDMSLPGFMKHLRVLEDAGLLERTKEGRVVRCTRSPGRKRRRGLRSTRNSGPRSSILSPVIFTSRRNCRHGSSPPH